MDSKATRHGTVNIIWISQEFSILCQLTESSGHRFWPKQFRQWIGGKGARSFCPVSWIAYRDAGDQSGRRLSDTSSSSGFQKRLWCSKRKLKISVTECESSAWSPLVTHKVEMTLTAKESLFFLTWIHSTGLITVTFSFSFFNSGKLSTENVISLVISKYKKDFWGKDLLRT